MIPLIVPPTSRIHKYTITFESICLWDTTGTSTGRRCRASGNITDHIPIRFIDLNQYRVIITCGYIVDSRMSRADVAVIGVMIRKCCGCGR